jgi:hypothetical protein
MSAAGGPEGGRQTLPDRVSLTPPFAPLNASPSPF